MTGKDASAVLVIDDDPDFRELIELVCVDWGLRFLEAPDCDSALRLLDKHEHTVQAVLLDYFMPGLSPGCCVNELSARLPKEVPIILVSATVDIHERAHNLGLERFLAKPFEMEELRTLLVGPPPQA